MGRRRKRNGGVAPPGELQPARATNFLWGLAGTAPEQPMIGREHGPIGAAVGPERVIESRDAMPPIARDEAPGAHASAPVTRNRRVPPGWPGLADDRPDLRRDDALEARRPADATHRAPLDDLLARAPSPPELSRELIEEVGFWVRHHRAGKKPPQPPASVSSAPNPATRSGASPIDASAKLREADAQREAGDLETAARSIGSALAIDLGVPGGLERHRSLAPVLARARALVSPNERVRREGSADERAAIEAFERRWQGGARLSAVLELRRVCRAGAGGACIERLLEAERALSLGRRERVRIDDNDVDVVFGRAAWLGRGDADIEVPSPVVSRQHLLFVAGEAGPIARDRGSANGTFVGTAGPRLELCIDRLVELRLGGEVPITAEPFGASHLLVRAPASMTLLVLGEELVLEGARIERWQTGDLSGWRLDSGRTTRDGVAWPAGELARGDRLSVGGVRLVI